MYWIKKETKCGWNDQKKERKKEQQEQMHTAALKADHRTDVYEERHKQ